MKKIIFLLTLLISSLLVKAQDSPVLSLPSRTTILPTDVYYTSSLLATDYKVDYATVFTKILDDLDTSIYNINDINDTLQYYLLKSDSLTTYVTPEQLKDSLDAFVSTKTDTATVIEAGGNAAGDFWVYGQLNGIDTINFTANSLLNAGSNSIKGVASSYFLGNTTTGRELQIIPGAPPAISTSQNGLDIRVQNIDILQLTNNSLTVPKDATFNTNVAVTGDLNADSISGTTMSISAAGNELRMTSGSIVTNNGANSVDFTHKDGDGTAGFTYADGTNTFTTKNIINYGGATFNEGGTATYDFRVETDNQASAFIIEGSEDTAGFNVPVTFNEKIKFTPQAIPSIRNPGDMYFDSARQNVVVYNKYTSASHDIGRELRPPIIYNCTGSTLYNTHVVKLDSAYYSGSTKRYCVSLADRRDTNEIIILGMITVDSIENGAYGEATWIGEINHCDNGLFNSNDKVYLDTAGHFTTTKPVDRVYPLGQIGIAVNDSGTILFNPQGMLPIVAHGYSTFDSNTVATAVTAQYQWTKVSTMTIKDTSNISFSSGTYTNNYKGEYEIKYDVSGLPETLNDVFTFTVFINGVNVGFDGYVERKYTSTTDIGSKADIGFRRSLNVGDTVELYLRNNSGPGDFYCRYGRFNIIKVD